MSDSYEKSSIGEVVRDMENNYVNGESQSSKYVSTSLYDDVQKVYAYLESKHISGDKDSMGRDKPFFNISIASRNIWFRATDIDRKDIRVKAKRGKDVTMSYIATALLQDWMRRENFGKFLNDWGINSAGFNESVLKFVEQDGRLIPSVVPWSRIICDSINFMDNPIIEVLELTEAQLYQRKGYDSKMVERLCDAVSTRTNLDGTQKDNKSGYIKLYEIHGNLPLSYLTGKEADEDEYVQQMHVISFVESKQSGEFDDFTLYSGRENNPYILSALLPEVDGSVSLRGAVKNLFQSQWMVNHSVYTIKNQLDLASKLIFQTSDGSFVGQNALSSIETGDILIHTLNQPLTQINNGSHDIVQQQNFHSMWKGLSNEINGISESMLGLNPPSGTAWRQTEALLNESHSLFEVMTENKRLDMELVLREKVLPFFKKKLNTTEEVSALLSDYGIDKIDKMYIRNEAVKAHNKEVVDAVLNNDTEKLAQLPDLQTRQGDLQNQMSDTMGDMRFIKPSDIPSQTWKDIFKDMEMDVEVVIPGENVNSDMATTLNSLLMFLARKQGQPMTPDEKTIIGKILEQTGAMSPLELSPDRPAPPQPTAMAPNASVGAVGGGLPIPTQ